MKLGDQCMGGGISDFLNNNKSILLYSIFIVIIIAWIVVRFTMKNTDIYKDVLYWIFLSLSVLSGITIIGIEGYNYFKSYDNKPNEYLI